MEYLADREAEGQDVARALQQLEAHVLPHWGRRTIASLEASELKAWRDELAQTPPRLRHGGRSARPRFAAVDLADADTRRRRRSTVNRITTIFKAALNYAADHYAEALPSRAAWRQGLKAFRRVDTARERWLRSDESFRLLHACRADFRPLAQAALYTGCRYGELCRAKVAHFDAARVTLHIPVSKSGTWRDVFLNDEAAAFFARLCAGRSRDEWLLTRHDPALVLLHDEFARLPAWTDDAVAHATAAVCRGLEISRGMLLRRLQTALPSAATRLVVLGRETALAALDAANRAPWSQGHQVRPIAEACRRARIEPPISFHGLRHTYASLALQAGMALPALARNLGHADTRMVEKHYGHLSDGYLREQVRRFAPGLDVRDENG